MGRKARKHIMPAGLCLNSKQGLLQQQHPLRSQLHFPRLLEDRFHFPLPRTIQKIG